MNKNKKFEYTKSSLIPIIELNFQNADLSQALYIVRKSII